MSEQARESEIINVQWNGTKGVREYIYYCVLPIVPLYDEHTKCRGTEWRARERENKYIKKWNKTHLSKFIHVCFWIIKLFSQRREKMWTQTWTSCIWALVRAIKAFIHSLEWNDSFYLVSWYFRLQWSQIDSTLVSDIQLCISSVWLESQRFASMIAQIFPQCKDIAWSLFLFDFLFNKIYAQISAQTQPKPTPITHTQRQFNMKI